jgi:hypothetical protein
LFLSPPPPLHAARQRKGAIRCFKAGFRKREREKTENSSSKNL